MGNYIDQNYYEPASMPNLPVPATNGQEAEELEEEDDDDLIDEPRHDEDQHLENIRRWMPGNIKEYVAVTNDEGVLLGHPELEDEAWWVSQIFRKINQEKVDHPHEADQAWQEMCGEPDKAIEELLSLFTSYNHSLTLAEFRVSGIMTRYYIRIGMMGVLLKRLVKKCKKNWTAWQKENIPQTRMRSLNDYMRIAQIPCAITYSIFGIARLLEFDRAVEKKKGTDPIKDLLDENDIKINPQDPEDFNHFKEDIDTGILKKRLIKAAEKNGIDLNISNDVVKKAIQQNISITNNDINHFLNNVEKNVSPDQAFEDLCDAKLNDYDTVSTITMPSIAKQIEDLKSSVYEACNNTELATEIDTKNIIQALREIIDIIEKA